MNTQNVKQTMMVMIVQNYNQEHDRLAIMLLLLIDFNLVTMFICSFLVKSLLQFTNSICISQFAGWCWI